jgi:putative FmdB family regulatory protein
MPLYEYECEACSKRFERIQKFSDPPIDVCPDCGKGPVKKLLSSPAIQFKGSGFYITDYAKKAAPESGTTASQSKGSPSESSSTSSTDASGSSSSSSSSAGDAKPASTPTDKKT